MNGTANFFRLALARFFAIVLFMDGVVAQLVERLVRKQIQAFRPCPSTWTHVDKPHIFMRF